MVVDDRIRLRIHQKFVELMGPEEADGLVENMVTVHDVATKDDLRVLSAELRVEMHQTLTSQTRWLVGYITAWSGVVLALARFLF